VAVTSYPYAWSAFPDGETLYAERVQVQIENDATITATCGGVTIDSDDETVVATFDRALDSAEETALDAVVAAYDDTASLAECKRSCILAVRSHFIVLLEKPDNGGSVTDDITAVDTAIAAVDSAADNAGAEAARDAYTGA
jgi:hypothetical protein